MVASFLGSRGLRQNSQPSDNIDESEKKGGWFFSRLFLTNRSSIIILRKMKKRLDFEAKGLFFVAFRNSGAKENGSFFI
jgi:hypothetical protein